MPRIHYLERYRRGEHERVWRELTELGDRACQEPISDQAKAVAHETMTRVLTNVSRLMPRLRDIGYRFAGRPHVPPTGNESALIGDYEDRYGLSVPLSLRAFYEVV